MSNEIFEQAYQAILELDEDTSYEILDKAIADEVSLTDLLTEGYSKGMQELGDKFSTGEVFLPDLMFAAEIMQTVSARIEEEMLRKGVVGEKKGKMIMATVQGDVHDIGKGICCSLLKTKGIEVYDLGRDVPPETIVDKAEEYGVDIIGMSALLTTTMGNQERVIKLLEERGIRDKYKIMIGGAPVTVRWAEKIGADAYTEDGPECAEKALEFLSI